MSDREEFEKWVKEGKDFYLGHDNRNEYINHTTRMQWVGWQARGELDAVRIKELKAINKQLEFRLDEWHESSINAVQRVNELTTKNKELEDKLDELVKFHSSADKLAEKQVDCIDQLAKFSTKLVIAVQALDCIASDIDTWHSDKAIEALNKIKGE